MRQHVVAEELATPQPGAMTDHQPAMRPQHGEVVGDRLGVGRTDADVHERDAVALRPGQVIGRHLRQMHGHAARDLDLAARPEARDRAGNAVRVTRELTITDGGKPFAEIDRGEIKWYVMVGAERREEFNRTLSLNLGDKLCFDAIIHNYGVTPIRTAGPWPGQEYRFAENRNTVAMRHAEATVSAQLPKGDQSWLRQTGVWRFGINFESTGIDFPYRWAIGSQADLERREMPGYGEQWYLLPGARGKVSGCIVIDQPPLLNTNLWWGGLIHEDVATVNNDIDRITVVVEAPSTTNGLSAIAELSGTTALSATASLSATLPITTANTVTQAAP